MNNHNINLLNSHDIEDIQKNVSYFLHKFDGIHKIIHDDIFRILEKECRVIYYPIANNEICAFYRKVDMKKFVYINTAIPYEKQVFAAAHELAHVLGVAEDRSEVLQSDDVKDYVDSHGSSKENRGKIENVANRFAAEFLVQTDVLKELLQINECKKNEISLRTIVELMDMFRVPYKTIVRRIYEIGYIETPELCGELLEIPARGQNSEVIRIQQRLELCHRNNEITNKKKLDNLVDLSLASYEKKLRTYQALKYLLNLADKTPEQFGINDMKEDLLSEEELDKLLSDEL
jgi:Zn-dependent peptidase ImmA (M78 family)